MNKRIVDDWHPHPLQEVRYKDAGGILEVTALSRINQTCNIRNLDKDHYVYLPTGEVFEKNHADTRAENIKVVRMSMNRLRDYINANVTDPRKARWITLTYAENMTDDKRLYKDFEKFIKRFRYRYPGFDYIVAMEPQARGAWHAHVIPIWPDEAPFIPNEKLARIWGHGFVEINALKDVDNVGVYLTAYLADMELADGVPAEALDGKHRIKEVNGKRYIKGARLYMYPVGFHLYRCSRGIKPPVVERITEAEAMEKVGAATPTFERTIELSDPESGLSIVINKRYYNRNRKKSQGENVDDAPISDRGIPDRPAGERKFTKDLPLLQPNPRILCKVYRPFGPDRLDPAAVQAVLYPPDYDWDRLHDDSNLCAGPPGLSDLVLQRGVHSREYPGPVQAPQGPA